MNILLICYYWPPLNAIGSHRPYWWARYFSEMGANVTVLTSTKYPYDGPLDLQLPIDKKIRVVEVPYAAFGQKGVSLLSQTKLWNGCKRMYRALRLHNKGWMDPRAQWKAAAIPHVATLAMCNDVVISTYSPREVHELARIAKDTNPKLRWIADYRDLWGQAKIPAHDERYINSPRDHEQATLTGSVDLVTSVSDELTNTCSQFFDVPGMTIMNGHDVSDDLLARRANTRGKKISSRNFTITHTGTLYEGTRDPCPLLEVLANMSAEGALGDNQVTVRFFGRDLSLVTQLSSDKRFQPFISVEGYKSREIIMQIQEDADALLLLEGSREEDRGVLTGKIFEYIASGTPILSLGSPVGSAIDRVLGNAGTGICAGTSRNKIRQFVADMIEGKLTDVFEFDVQKVRCFHRDTQSRKLLDYIRNLEDF